MRRDHEQVALERLFNLLEDAILHLVRIFSLEKFIDDHSIGQLHGEPVFVHRDLFHVVSALYPNFLLRDEVLYDDVCHGVPIRVPVLIQAVHGTEESWCTLTLPSSHPTAT